MFSFNNSEFLWLFLLLLPLGYLMQSRGDSLSKVFSKEIRKRIEIKGKTLSKAMRNGLMLLSLALVILGLARPQIDNGEVIVKSSFINVIVGIDMSKSMFANDVYPTRFAFAQQKFLTSLEHFKNAKVALMGFSSQTFLISPLTEDFNSLKFLTKNMKPEYLSLAGTDILATLSSANEMFGKEKKKIVLLFTDGGDQKSFEREINYAKEHNMVVYIYNIGTIKGGVIKERNGVLKDKDGNIVVVKRTENIKELAMQTGGGYLNYSLSKDDIKHLVETIHTQFKAKEEQSSTIRDKKELFYYPLSGGIFLFFLALFSFSRLSIGGKND
jgi:Ca-activated chloride channel family protein